MRDDFLGHAQHDFLHQAEVAVFDVGQFDLAQQLFSNSAAGHIGMQNELLLNIVTDLLAQPVLPRSAIPDPDDGPERGCSDANR